MDSSIIAPSSLLSIVSISCNSTAALVPGHFNGWSTDDLNYDTFYAHDVKVSLSSAIGPLMVMRYHLPNLSKRVQKGRQNCG